MADEIIPEWVQRYIAETARLAQSVPHVEPLPAEVIRTVQALRPYIDNVVAAMDQLAVFNSVTGIQARQQAAMAAIVESFGTTHRLPVPTARELAEAEAELRARVVPETSEEELQKAVAEIPADPEKVKLAAFLAEVIRKATGLPAPWVVFVVVFCLAVKMNPDEVGALALAYAVMQDVRRDD
jgi:hypothetical protein